MLRVCGITYDHTVNYGSALQAYALQKAVESVKMTDGTGCSYSLIPIKVFRDWPSKQTLIHKLLLPLLRYYHAQFVLFETKRLHFAQIDQLADLPKLNDIFDAFICGSDVIWNPDMNHGLNAFYLDFAQKYKFSYAASFGKAEIDDSVLSSVSTPLSELDAVSVREQSAAEVVSRCCGRIAQVVSDPVLLHTCEFWESVIPKKNNKKKYIFVYITHFSASIQDFLERLKKQTGLKIVYSAHGPKQALSQGMLQVQPPEQWLRLLHDAEYVVTNSFHATAFSVLFHRKFFTVVNGDKTGGINVRMNDFLTFLGLGDRILSSVPEHPDLAEIDYTEADKLITETRERSIEFLRDNLEVAYCRKQEHGDGTV